MTTIDYYVLYVQVLQQPRVARVLSQHKFLEFTVGIFKPFSIQRNDSFGTVMKHACILKHIGVVDGGDEKKKNQYYCVIARTFRFEFCVHDYLALRDIRVRNTLGSTHK